MFGNTQYAEAVLKTSLFLHWHLGFCAVFCFGTAVSLDACFYLKSGYRYFCWNFVADGCCCQQCWHRSEVWRGASLQSLAGKGWTRAPSRVWQWKAKTGYWSRQCALHQWMFSGLQVRASCHTSRVGWRKRRDPEGTFSLFKKKNSKKFWKQIYLRSYPEVSECKIVSLGDSTLFTSVGVTLKMPSCTESFFSYQHGLYGTNNKWRLFKKKK